MRLGETLGRRLWAPTGPFFVRTAGHRRLSLGKDEPDVMKTRCKLLAVSLLLATITGRGQPTITSFILNGQAQTGNDAVHRYLRYSVSPGALVYFTVTVSGGV